MNLAQFYRRNAVWLAVIAAILVAWSIDRNNISKRALRAEVALFHSRSQAAVAKSDLKAVTFANSVNERQRRTAMGTD